MNEKAWGRDIVFIVNSKHVNQNHENRCDHLGNYQGKTMRCEPREYQHFKQQKRTIKLKKSTEEEDHEGNCTPEAIRREFQEGFKQLKMSDLKERSR